MPLIPYVNDVAAIIKADPSMKASIFDPRINDSVISCYNIMNEYTKRQKKKSATNPPTPNHVSLKKRGEKSTTTFKFDGEIDQDLLDTVIDDLKLKNISTDINDDGTVIIDIEK